MSNSDTEHKPLDIRIVVHRFEQAEVDIPIFEVEISQEPSGMWCETFGTLELLNAFLTGVRCGINFRHPPLTLIPTLREMPAGWNLQRAPYQIWPERVPGEEEYLPTIKDVNWCYGCKRTLPDDMEIEHDDFEGIPWHRFYAVTESVKRSDHVRIKGVEVDVCGPVFRQKRTDSGEAIKRLLRDDQ